MDRSGLAPGESDSQGCFSASHCTPKVKYAFSPSGVVVQRSHPLGDEMGTGPHTEHSGRDTTQSFPAESFPGCFYRQQYTTWGYLANKMITLMPKTVPSISSEPVSVLPQTWFLILVTYLFSVTVFPWEVRGSRSSQITSPFC